MAVSVQPFPQQFSYADLESFPEDNLRREIVRGELFVNPSPVTRHQSASMALSSAFFTYSKHSGGKAFAAPMDVFFSENDVVQPDLSFIRGDHLDRIQAKRIEGPPDLVVEISSPSTRHLDLVRKRELYRQFMVPEFWFVDLEAERVEIYILHNGAYQGPVIKYPGENLESSGLPGLLVPVAEALAAEEHSDTEPPGTA